MTYDEAVNEKNRQFEHMTLKNADGTPLRARRNGKTQTWKTRPGEFRLPAKHGLRNTFQITHTEAAQWKVSGT